MYTVTGGGRKGFLKKVGAEQRGRNFYIYSLYVLYMYNTYIKGVKGVKKVRLSKASEEKSWKKKKKNWTDDLNHTYLIDDKDGRTPLTTHPRRFLALDSQVSTMFPNRLIILPNCRSFGGTVHVLWSY